MDADIRNFAVEVESVIQRFVKIYEALKQTGSSARFSLGTYNKSSFQTWLESLRTNIVLLDSGIAAFGSVPFSKQLEFIKNNLDQIYTDSLYANRHADRFVDTFQNLRSHIVDLAIYTTLLFNYAMKYKGGEVWDAEQAFDDHVASMPFHHMRSNKVHFPLKSDQVTPQVSQSRALIISSGDISDVDGFFAIAEYAKSGADVLFVMNYPAYLGEDQSNTGLKDYGLGFQVSADAVFRRDIRKLKEVPNKKYEKFLENYLPKFKLEGVKALEESDDDSEYKKIMYKHQAKEIMKGAMTDLAHNIVNTVWEKAGIAGQQKGNLFFCIGGFNEINPFSLTAVKNEILVFSDAAQSAIANLIEPHKGNVYDEVGNTCNLNLRSYENIYMDFNGSMAFFTEENSLYHDIKAVAHKIKGVFIMGGVLAEEMPRTIPAIPNVLNRLSSATMNQLYHTQGTALFFQFLKKYAIKSFVVTNNSVSDVSTADDKADKVFNGLNAFMTANGIMGNFLSQMAYAYYARDKPQKPFDYYTALALVKYFDLDISDSAYSSKKILFFNRKQGACLVSTSKNAEDAVRSYASKIKDQSEAFNQEIIEMDKMEWESLGVFDIAFDTESDGQINLKNRTGDIRLLNHWIQKFISRRQIVSNTSKTYPVDSDHYEKVFNVLVSSNVDRISRDVEIRINNRFKPRAMSKFFRSALVTTDLPGLGFNIFNTKSGFLQILTKIFDKISMVPQRPRDSQLWNSIHTLTKIAQGIADSKFIKM